MPENPVHDQGMRILSLGDAAFDLSGSGKERKEVRTLSIQS
jgi:hypothetical protein